MVAFEFTDEGRRRFADVTKRIAQQPAIDRIGRIAQPGEDEEVPAFAITLDNRIVSLASIDPIDLPEGIDGRTGAQVGQLDRGDPGPRREPAHRRSPDRAQADLADPGLGHAWPAGP